MPECVAYHDVAASIASQSTYSYLALNSEELDTDGMHDPASNNSRITAKTAGRYILTAKLRWGANAGSYREAVFRKNGSTLLAGRTLWPNTNVAWPTTLSLLADLALNDYIELGVRQESGASINIEAESGLTPYISAVLLNDDVYADIYHSQNQAISSGGLWRFVTFDSELADADGMHDPSVNPTRLTIPFDGWYAFWGQVSWAANTSSLRGIMLQVDGTEDRTSGGHTNTPSISTPWLQQIFTFIHLTQGQYVELGVRQATGSNLDVEFVSGLSPVLRAARLAQLAT